MPIPAELIGSAAEAAGSNLVRRSDRTAPGPGEVEEIGLALRDALATALKESSREEVHLNLEVPIEDWSQPSAQVDLGLGTGSDLALVAELQVGDVGHQLFGVAKVCCLLKANAAAGFLLCTGRSGDAFESQPGGELFRNERGLEHGDVFPVLFQRHPAEARKLLAAGRPGPISLPRRFSTTAVCDPVELDAYPGHQLRAVEVRIEDPTPIPITPEVIGADR